MNLFAALLGDWKNGFARNKSGRPARSGMRVRPGVEPLESRDVPSAISLFETTDSSFSPATAVANDTSPVELGVKFTSFEAGSVSAVQFYRGAPSASGFTVHLWDNSGNLLATGAAPGNQAPGWQTVDLDQTVQLQADATYEASYYASGGSYSVNQNDFTTQGISRGPLLAFSAQGGSETGTPAVGNGFYHYGQGGGFPDQTYLNSNYWVSPVFQPDPSVGAAPSITSISVRSGPTLGGGSLTINGANFTPDAIAPTVYFGDSKLVSGYIFSANQITLTVPPHPAGTVDVRVVTDAGESDITAADQFQYFASPPPPAPITAFETTDPSFAPAIPVADDQSAVELGVTFSATPGTVSAIQFYRGAPSNSGFTVHLWDHSGNLLASGEAPGNQVPGWQTVNLDLPIHIGFGVYVASYYTSAGEYAVDQHYQFQSRGPLSLGHGVYTYGTGGGFPTQTYQFSNYWVGPVLQPDASGPPAITSLSQGSAAAGSTLTINGAYFDGSSVVYFGDAIATSVTVVSPSQISVVVPPHAADTVDVRVITSAGESPVSAADRFSYLPANAISLFETGDPTFAPAIPVANDTSPVELGVRFSAIVPGTVNAIQFYRGSPSGSGFVVHLWDSAGNVLGSGEAPGNQAAGWQTVDLDGPVHLDANVTYVASYFTSTGGYADDQNYEFQSRGPLSATQGVFFYGAGGAFPDQTYLNSNYWVGPIFQPDPVLGPAPVVTSISMTSSPTGGGTVLTIHGTNFPSGALDIYFGDVKSLNWTLVDANTLAALIPAHPAGTVDVRVITEAGESDPTAADLFTYTP